MTPAGGIAARDVVFELSFNVAQQGGRAKAEQVGLQPARPEFVFDHCKVHQRVFGFADAACGFVADFETGPGVIVADRADHGEGHGQGRVNRFLACAGLDEIRARHHAHDRGACDVAQRPQFPRRKDRFDVGGATGGAHLCHFIIKRLPVSLQHVAAGDDDVDFLRACVHAFADFGKAQVQRR